MAMGGEEPFAERADVRSSRIVEMREAGRIRRTLRRGAVCASAAAGVLGTPRAARADTLFTGPEVQDAKSRSIDIVDSHLQFLAAQARYGQALSTGAFTTRWAPGRVLLNDGSRMAANLSRTQLMFSTGAGSLETGAVFGGATFDFVRLANPFFASIPRFSGSEGGEAEAFFGVAYASVQLTYSLAVSGVQDSADNRDPFGNYQSEASRDIAWRPNTPYPASTGNQRPKFSFLSGYEARTGAFASLVWVEHGGQTRLAESRLHLQPLSGLVPQGIRDTLGLPALGLRKLDEARDYYGERTSSEVRTAPVEVPSLPSEYETDFGSDDVLRGGFLWRAHVRVSPSALFRYGELGYVQDFGAEARLGARIGAKALIVRRGDAYAPAGEGIVLMRAGSGPSAAYFGVSYSYDSPESATFLPIRGAHVLGVQVVLGPPETARPLIPLVRDIEARRGAQRGGARP